MKMQNRSNALKEVPGSEEGEGGENEVASGAPKSAKMPGDSMGNLFLDDEDMRHMIDLHEEFLTRHTTIRNSIEDTYRIGGQLLDYVRKQMIIDYHLRGEQHILEQEFPDIAKKAKKFLSYEVYFELSKSQKPGTPMTPEDPFYDLLMEKQKLIIDRIMADYEKHVEISSERAGEKVQ